MIKFRDFVPPQEQLGLLGEPSLTTLEAAVEAASNWVEAFHIDVLNIETLLLPNLASDHQTNAAEFEAEHDDDKTYWYQAVRVWYRETETIHSDDEIRIFDED